MASLAFEDLCERIGSLTAAGLRERHGTAFLLINIIPEEAQGPRLAAFDTALGAEVGVLRRSMQETLVHPLRKSAGALGLMSAGRSATNDLVLDHESISKVHAYFEQREDGSFVLWDAGSRNGTFLDNQPVSREKRLLKPGAVVRFAEAFSGSFHTAESLYDFARFSARMRG